MFDRLLKNTIARFTNDRSAVYKELLDLHDDHFKLEGHTVDMAVARLGDDQRTLLEVDPYVFAMRIVASGQRRASVFYDVYGRTRVDAPEGTARARTDSAAAVAASGTQDDQEGGGIAPSAGAAGGADGRWPDGV